jgi:hypothetical protein
LKKYQSFSLLTLLLAFAFTGCTRPATHRAQTGDAGTLTPAPATLPAPTFSTIQDTHPPERTPTAHDLPEASDPPPEIPIPVKQIPLVGPIASPEAEISGMAWYGDILILIPQYPNHFPLNGEGSVFALHKSDVLDFIQGRSNKPLSPIQIAFSAPNLESSIRGFEGFESIAIDGDQVFMTIEAKPSGMMGYLIAGTIASDLSEIRVDPTRISQILPQTGLPNFSDEALLVFGSRLITIYEVTGEPFNPAPVAHMYDFDLQLQDTLAFPNIPYRISDATPPDDSGRFWAINFTLRGNEDSGPPTESLMDEVWKEISQFETLERLVEFQFSEAGIVLSDTPPILFKLPDNQQTSNWEAIARLDESGFLLATDEHPDTILGFVLSP